MVGIQRNDDDGRRKQSYPYREFILIYEGVLLTQLE